MKSQTPSTRRTPRVAFVVTARVTAEMFVSRFATFLARQGFEVTVIADGVSPKTTTFEHGSLRMLPISISRDPSPIDDIRSLFALRRALKSVRPDILTYATPKASLLASIAGFSLRVPVRVYQLWGLRLETMQGAARTVLAMMERITSRLSTSVLANSQSLAGQYEDFRLGAGKRATVLGSGSSHGVDTAHFSREQHTERQETQHGALRERSSAMVIGFVGRLHPDKGIDTLLDAVRLLVTSGDEVTLLLVGGDEGAHLDLSGGLEPLTKNVGHTEDPRPYYEIMDVLVLPSRREGFPNVVLEAAAMSVPAVVSDATGTRDSVVHEETGLIVQIDDSAELADSLSRLIRDSQEREKFGTAARARVEKLFRQELVWTRTLDYLLTQARARLSEKRLGRIALPDASIRLADQDARTRSIE